MDFSSLFPNMRQVQTAVILIFIGSILAFSFASSQGFLRVSGTNIVNEDGQEVILRGIGLGGWLVPEGYMLHTSGFANSPTEIRNKISALIGPANTDSFFTLYRKNYVARKDIDQLAQWGFNSVRLPMHYNLLTPKNQPYVYSEEGFAMIDSLLSWCEANHLYLILDLHCAPGGQNKANISDYIPGEFALWESADNQNRTIALWKKIAERYATREWIGGYDLLNETVWTFGSAYSLLNLRDLSIAITSAIRQVDTTHIVFIEGNTWATDFTDLTPPWDAQLVYSFHKYWNGNDYASIANYITLRSNSNRPLWLGESGENSNEWFAECIALMESNGIGWSWWPHKKIEFISGPLSATLTPQYNALLNYWNGQGDAPSDPVAALYGEAAMLSIDQCRVQSDIIDAMFRQPYSNETIPYAANQIPGTIFAANYDIGKIPFAYKDNDYQQVPQGQAYNSGGMYRNDGVDIERISDLPVSNGYDVGWINDNEFLRFTVDVQQTGNYSVDLRVASLSGGAQILVQVDDSVSIGGIVDIAATGGWQSWKTVHVGEQALAAGKHKLRILFVTGGLNLSYIQFSVITTVQDDEKQKPYSFGMEQNYPNPFNPTTRIKFSSTGNYIQLKVYDAVGREVQTLADGQLSAGYHEVTFNADGLPSGVYYCRLQSGNDIQTLKMDLVK
jgi:hypothetical protein